MEISDVFFVYIHITTTEGTFYEKIIVIDIDVCLYPAPRQLRYIPADGDNPIQPPQEMTSIQSTSEENTPQLSCQDLAQRAYRQILDCFGGLLPHDPGHLGYPAEFGNAYYEDGRIVVCLPDSSQEMQEKYRSMVDTPKILRFREVAYSYNALYALQEAISSPRM